MNEPWQVYFEELHERAADVPEQEFNRAEDVAEAAHEAYESTVYRLVNQLDYEEADAIALTKAFGRAVKEWIGEEVYEWDELREKLEEQQHGWDSAGIV